MTYLTKNFSIAELTASNTAKRRGINNVPSAQAIKNLEASAINLWQPLRDALGTPFLVSSGYRSPRLNKAIGGSATSAHCHGFAIDFISPSFGDTRELAKELHKQILELDLDWDQLILEYPETPGSWIHLGYKHQASGKHRKQLLVARKKHGRTIYEAVKGF